MGNAQWVLELALLMLLTATLFHALRLERALGVLKRDRAVLEELVEGFNDSTRQAESGIEKLREAADGVGRQMVRQIDAAQLLRDDLSFLTERSDRLAERLEAAVRSARMCADAVALPGLQVASSLPVHLPRPALTGDAEPCADASPSSRPFEAAGPHDTADLPRLRSQAERDLLHVLRAGR